MLFLNNKMQLKLEAMASWSLLLAFLKWISLAWCHGGVEVSWGCHWASLGRHKNTLRGSGVSWECHWESLGCLGMS